MIKVNYDNEIKKTFYNENLLRYKELNDLAIKASREEEGYQQKRDDMIRRYEEDNAFWLKPSKKIVEEKEIEEDKIDPIKEKVVKVKDQKITNFQCECGCYLIRKDGMERHKKTKKHETLMALKVLNDQMEKLSIEKTKNPPVGPVATKAPSIACEISYIPVEI